MTINLPYGSGILMKIRKQNLAEMIYLGLAAFVIMLLATRSSFLYPCNNWDDANSYFSVGKAIFNGKLPYREVFDQKGYLLYFLYGFCYLVSHTTFRGVFLMEWIFAAFDLWGICRILHLYLKRSTSLFLAPLPLALVFCSYSFYWGGAAEELCFPFLIWGLFLGLKYFKTEYPYQAMNKGTLFAAGILAGVVANIKFTVLGFFFAWMMWVAFAQLVRKDWKRAFTSCGWFLLGMLLPFVPGFLYFGIRGALYDWYWGYVYINVFLYSNLDSAGPSVGERIYIMAKILYWLIRRNFIYYAVLIPGMFVMLIQRGQKWMSRLFVPVLFLFLFVGIYIGGSELPYYALPLGIFTVFGIVLIGMFCEKAAVAVPQRMNERKKQKVTMEDCHGKVQTAIYGGVGVLSILFCVWIVAANSVNISWMKVKREEIFLYHFKEIVSQSEDPTLLNIGCLDAGLYTVCDIVPTCRWFQTQTINSDVVLKEQEGYIKEGNTEYVLARDTYPAAIREQYELVAEEVFDDGNYISTYYLFRRKGE